MTVAAQTPTISYAENGITTAFSVPFRYNAPTDLAAVRRAADGVETVLAFGLDYTASAGATDAGGTLTVTAAAASGTTLIITRQTARQQTADYVTNGAFSAESHERALDQAMLVAQEQDAQLARTLRVPLGEAGFDLGPDSAREGRVFAFGSGGAPALDIEAEKVRQLIAAGFNPAITQLADNVSFLAPGTGAVARTVGDKLRETVSVFDYLSPLLQVKVSLRTAVAGDGPAIRAAIQATVDAVGAAGGGIVHMPAGNYPTDGEVVIANDNVTVSGDGMTSTIIIPSTAGQNVFVVSKPLGVIGHCTISDLGIAPAVGITDCIRVVDHFWFVAKNIRFPNSGFGFVSGVNLHKGATAFLAFLENVFCINPNASAGVRVGENGTGDIQNVILRNCHLDNADAGLRVANVGGLQWIGGEALDCGRAMVIETVAATDRVKAVFASQVFFDNAANEVLRVVLGNAASRISGVGFSNCSFNFSQAGPGIIVAGNALEPGQLERVRFDSCDILLNEQAGAVFSNCHDVKLVACNIQGNSASGTGLFAGLFADTGVSGFQVIGGSSGGGDEFPASQSHGIVVSAGADKVRITNVDLVGNATGALLDGGVSDIIVSGCVGYRTAASGGATVLSGGTSVLIDPGLGAPVSVENVIATQLGNTPEAWWIEGVSATEFKIQLASAAGADRQFSWQARIKGA